MSEIVKRKKMFDIDGRVVVVTGAAGALCGNLAEALADLGAQVAVLDINLDGAREKAETIRSVGGSAEAFECNVLDERSVSETARRIEELWGVPDALVNGAGGNHPDGSTSVEFVEAEYLKSDRLEPDQHGQYVDTRNLFDLSFEGFRKVFDLNFFGTFVPSKIFAEGMARRGRGAIVNFSSMTALTPLTKVGGYGAAKAAVSNFTTWLAVHLSHVGVRVNAIAPGFFMTEQLRFLHIDQETGELTPRAKATIAHTPMGRYGEPEDLVGAVVYLLSDASGFVTGITLPIDGGFASFSL